MKKLIFILAVINMLISCIANDEDNLNHDAERSQQIKNLIALKAHEYGVNEYIIDDTYISEHVNMSEEEIESSFLLLSKLNGTFYSLNTQKNNSTLLTKQRRTNILDPSAESGSISATDFGTIDTLEIRYEVNIDFNYSKYGHSYVTLNSFTVEKHVENPIHSGFYEWQQLSSSCYNPVYRFQGMGVHFIYEFFAQISCNGISVKKNCVCDYSSGAMSLRVQDI